MKMLAVAGLLLGLALGGGSQPAYSISFLILFEPFGQSSEPAACAFPAGLLELRHR